MCRTITAIVLTAIPFFFAAASTSLGFAEAIQVGDGIIYIGDGNEPNGASPSVPCPQIMPEMGPALVFVDNQQIVYRHIPLAGPNDVNVSDLAALCVFKQVNATTGQTTEIARAILRLSMGFGSLELDPLNGELIYNTEWTIDPNEGTIASAIVPYSIVQEYQPSRVTVLLGEEVVQGAGGTIWSKLISARHKHLAWVVHVTDAEPGYTMYVKVDDIAGPIETAKGIYTTVPWGWVE